MRPHRSPDEQGSAVVEVAWVGAILTVVTVSVLQLALALHVRNTVLDSAAEGARFAALADNTAMDGVVRCQNLITAAIGADYATDIRASTGTWMGHPAVTITVRTTLPVIGLLGIGGAVEVSGHAAIETLD